MDNEKIEDFFKSVLNDEFDNVGILLKSGIDINATDSFMYTALWTALYHKKKDMIIYLLKNGANPNMKNGKDQAAGLHLVAKGSDIPLAELLVQHGADINIQDEKGSTPLMAAVMSYAEGDDTAMIEFLVIHGADPSHKNKSGASALKYADFPAKSAVKPLLMKFFERK